MTGIVLFVTLLVFLVLNVPESANVHALRGKVFVRSGAGIVADSVPEREYEECLNKAKATLKALELAEEVEE